MTDVGSTLRVTMPMSSVEIRGLRGPAQGTFKARIPDHLTATQYCHSAKRSWTCTLGTEINNGNVSPRHTLTLTCGGPFQGTGTAVGIDWIKVDGAIVPLSDVVAGWAPVTASAASSDRYVQSDNAGTKATFTFRGTGAVWKTVTGPWAGKASILVDGKVVRTVDNYSSAVDYGVERHVGGLSDGVHTITVEVLGTNRAASTGKRIAVDGWSVD